MCKATLTQIESTLLSITRATATTSLAFLSSYSDQLITIYTNQDSISCLQLSLSLPDEAP